MAQPGMATNGRDESPPLALVTGASRRAGIGAAIAVHLARDGWDVATTFWRDYDRAMPHGSDPGDVEWWHEQLTLLVRKGNPLGIQGLADVTRTGARLGLSDP